MQSRLFTLVCFSLLLSLSGCGTTGYQGPRMMTWNVTIDSTPPGAELSWRAKGEQNNRPLGKSPMTVAIPLPVTDYGVFDEVFIFATVGNATSYVSTHTLLDGGPLSSDGYHSAEKAARLPSRVTVNAYEAHKFETHAGIGLLREYEKNPEMWKPYVTSVDGKVLSIQESGQGCVVQLIVENQKNVVVYWPLSRMPNVIEGTYMKVLGSVVGRTSGTNAFGGTVTALTCQAYGYVADWSLTPTTHYLPGKKELFDRWAEGSLFAGEGLVSVDSGSSSPNEYILRKK